MKKNPSKEELEAEAVRKVRKAAAGRIAESLELQFKYAEAKIAANELEVAESKKYIADLVRELRKVSSVLERGASATLNRRLARLARRVTALKANLDFYEQPKATPARKPRRKAARS
jgi:polyhydroxyalkanoate synthesis regulator phasin